MEIKKTPVCYDGAAGTIRGENCLTGRKKLSEIAYLFRDREALGQLDPDTPVYEVQSHEAVPAGTPGGLYFGISTVHPGKVGNEYYMTKGHFHSRRETAEYYWGISGSGVLLLMDEQGQTSAELIEKGSLHYIPGRIAHRLINTGEEDLVVGAVWPSDAGHDYASIETEGFTLRVVEKEGKAVLVED